MGDQERMHHVGVAGIPDLQLVMFRGEAEGLLELGEMVARPRFMRLGEEFREQLVYGRLGRWGRETAGLGYTDAARFRGHNSIV